MQEHLGDLYQKTGRLKLAAAHWERAVQEWSKTVPAEQDGEAFAKVQQKLDAAKVKLAKEESRQALRLAMEAVMSDAMIMWGRSGPRPVQTATFVCRGSRHFAVPRCSPIQANASNL